jgi:hypothetical protein
MQDRRQFTGRLLTAGFAVVGAGGAAHGTDAEAAGSPAAADGGAAAGGAAAAPRTTGFDAATLESVSLRHRIYRAIRFGSEGETVFWWMRGRRYALVGNQMTPLFGMEVGSAHRARDIGNGEYEVTATSAIFYTDLSSGALLTDWLNPVSKQAVRFEYAAPRASRSRYRYATGPVLDGPGAEPGMQRRVDIGPIERIGEQVVVREETYLVMPPAMPAAGAAAAGAAAASTATAAASASAPPSPAQRYVQDMYTYHCPVALLTSGRSDTQPTIHFNDYNDFSPRLKMGAVVGSSVAGCSGQRVSSLDGMPRRWLQLARSTHAESWANLDRVFASGERA